MLFWSSKIPLKVNGHPPPDGVSLQFQQSYFKFHRGPLDKLLFFLTLCCTATVEFKLERRGTLQSKVNTHRCG